MVVYVQTIGDELSAKLGRLDELMLSSECSECELTVGHISVSIGRLHRLRDDITARRRQLLQQSRSLQAGPRTPVCFRPKKTVQPPKK